MEEKEVVIEESLLKKIKIPLINTIFLIITLIFFLIDSLLPRIFTNVLFIIGFVLGIVFVGMQILFLVLKKDKVLKIFKTINEYYQVLLVAVIVVEIVFTFFLFPATVQQTSMMDTLLPGDNLIVTRNSKIDNFDIVVFAYDNEIQRNNIGINDGELLIKRVIAGPNDSFYYKNDKLYINGKVVEDKFFVDKMNGLSLESIARKNNKEDICKREDGTYVLPDKWYVVFGDNRVYTMGGDTPLSIDSRTFGLVHEDQIFGVAKYKMKSIFNWEKLVY